MKLLANRSPAFLAIFALIVFSVLVSGCLPSGGGDSAFPSKLARDVIIESQTPSTSPPGPTTRITATLYLPDNHQSTHYPLILHSHGWGLSRVSAAEAQRYEALTSTDHLPHFQQLEALIPKLRAAGYAVISYDQRGFGRGQDGDNGSEDGSHGMSPNFEIQDARAVIDWAVANLNVREESPGNPVVGMIGASYGGAYQLMTAAEDFRINAIVPSVTWFDLAQALSPNRVLKKSWVLGICGVVESHGAELAQEVELACQQASEPRARELNDAPAAEHLYFNNGLSHYMEQPGFTLPPVNALILHSSRDTLFNQNEADNIFKALRTGGGDVKLLTHAASHETPAQLEARGAQEPASNCGSLDTVSTVFHWLNEKLRGAPAPLLPQICLALDDQRAIHLEEIPRASHEHGVTIPLTQVDSSHNNDSHAANDALFIPLSSAPAELEGKVIAGIPIAQLHVEAGLGNVDPSTALPLGISTDHEIINRGGDTAGIFIGVGIRRGGELLLLNDQVQPLLSSDSRTSVAPGEADLVGVSAALQAGDEIGVLLYGKYDVFDNFPGTPSNWSENVAIVSGTIYLPIFTPDSIDSRD